jgi:hypothetical protein
MNSSSDRYLVLAEKLCIGLGIFLIVAIRGIVLVGAPPEIMNGLVFLLIAVGSLLIVVQWGMKW